MKLKATPLAGVYETVSTPVVDHRGVFARLFCASALNEAHKGRAIVQISQGLTRIAGTVRGLHYQHPPQAEAKWVRCLKGRIWDVAVDLRRGSPTFLCWHAVELHSERVNALLVPEGCAHGYQALEPDSELLYLSTAPYTPKLEGGARWDDPRLRIAWPLPAENLSERDRSLPLLGADFEGIAV